MAREMTEYEFIEPDVTAEQLTRHRSKKTARSGEAYIRCGICDGGWKLVVLPPPDKKVYCVWCGHESEIERDA